ncbi:hypothetical protein HDU76_007388 [Blyttiomyces sp. JEL0837]|nr:hypothetical protein HDU76_007388 [Blyttiomyces sp. JEL0837]
MLSSLSDEHHHTYQATSSTSPNLTNLPLELRRNIVLLCFHSSKGQIPQSLYNYIRESCKSMKEAVDSIPKCISINLSLFSENTYNYVMKQQHEEVTINNRMFRIVKETKQYEMVMQATKVMTSTSSSTSSTSLNNIINKQTRSFLSVAVCDVSINTTVIAEQAPNDLTNLLNMFVGMTVLRETFNLLKWELVWNELAVQMMGYVDENVAGAIKLIKIRKFISGLIPWIDGGLEISMLSMEEFLEFNPQVPSLQAMVEVFSGVKKLIVGIGEVKTPMDNEDYNMLLGRAQSATGLSEIVLNLDYDCPDFEKDCGVAIRGCSIALRLGHLFEGQLWD